MCQIGTSTSSSAVIVKPRWRVLCRFVGFLLTTSKNRRAALILPVSSTGYVVALQPTSASPAAAECHEQSIEIPQDDEAGRLICLPVAICGAPSQKITHSRSISAVLGVEAHAEGDLNTPLLDRRWSVSFPASKAHPRETPAKEQEKHVGGSHRTIEVRADHVQEQEEEEEEEESEICDDAAVDDVRDTQVSNPTAPPTPVRPEGYLSFLWKACNNAIIMFYLTAAVLSFLTGFMAQGFKNGWHDGAAIIVAIFLVVVVSSAANYYRAKKLEKKRLARIKVKVTRSGNDEEVEISEVKEGDVVKLEEGSIIPADGLFIDGNNLVLDEILNPEINQDHNKFLFFGSRVISGTGTMLVTSTADRNAMLVEELSGLDPARGSLLEDRVNKPHDHMETLALLVPLFVLFQALVRVSHQELGVPGEKPDLKGEVSVKQVVHLLTKIVLFPRGMVPVLVSSLGLMVIGLQHGVPLVISLTLAHWNLTGLSARIHNLWACTTMGIITVLYINTTCGSICDGMKVARAWICEREMPCDEECPETPELVLESLHQAIEVSARVPEISASPRNSVLRGWADSKWSLTNKFRNKRYVIIDFKKLRSDRKGRGTLMRKEGSVDEGSTLYLHWKGAASPVLEMCSHYINQAGIRCLLEERKETFKTVIKDMEETGLVTIAFATREMDVEEITETGLNLLAIVGLKLEISDETKSAIRELTRMGIRIVLVSEDKPSTLGLMAHELKVGEGPELREEVAVKDITEMEGLKPDENQKLVGALKRKGDVVAFCGGSTSDIPTLKEADLAITEHDKSTQMAKEAADMVLNDGMASLPEIVKLGRCGYSNIQIFTQVQLSTWISWFVLALVVAICSGDSPTTLLQQIWVGAVMSFLGALMMRMELGLPSLPAWRPNHRTKPLIERAVWIGIAGQVSCQLFVFLMFQFKGRDILGVGRGVHSAMMFASFTLCQVLNQVKATKTGTVKDLAVILCRHYWFPVTTVAIVAVQVVMVQFGQSLADGLPLSGVQWILSCGIAILPPVLHWSGSRIGVFLFSAMSSGHLPGLSRQMFWILVTPFSVILIVTASQIIQPAGVRTFR